MPGTFSISPTLRSGAQPVAGVGPIRFGLCVAALEREQLERRSSRAAGTGSAEFDGPGGVYTELQTGSYIFMDADYLAVDISVGRFSPALFVDTTVVGVQWDDHVTTDAGTKAFCSQRASAYFCSGGALVDLLLRRR